MPGPQNTDLAVIGFSIQDGDAPDDDFHLHWVLEQIEIFLTAGKKVAISCHGGHGRTGTIIALLLGRAAVGAADPIKATREAGCSKMIETYKQRQFIFDYFKLELPEIYKPVGVAPIQGGVKSPQTRTTPLPPHDAQWMKDWTDPVWRLKMLKDQTKEHLTLDFGPDQVFTLANGEDIGVDKHGDEFPAILIWDKEGEEEVLLGGIVRFLCTACVGDMALHELYENIFECSSCGNEHYVPTGWGTKPVQEEAHGG